MLVLFRNLKKYKGFSFINIVGLAMGMAVCMLILLWVVDELTYDSFHEHSDRIYRVCIDAFLGQPLKAPVCMAPAGPAMKETFPEVLDAARLVRPRRASVLHENRPYSEDDVGYADASFFTIFSFPFVSGDPATALNAANTVVITKDVAEKYFGNADPLGNILEIEGTEYSVTAVVKNPSTHSHLSFRMLRSFETLYQENREALENWLSASYYTYLLLDENVDIASLENKFPALIDAHLGPVLKTIGGSLALFLQPLKRIHLYSRLEGDMASAGDISYIYLFCGIALFVLIVACINFINLVTARSSIRASEIGIRKTLGAARERLVRQFLGESILYAFLSFLLGFILVCITLPLFNILLDRQLSINIGNTPWLIPAFLGLTVCVGLFAGSYPALYLSGFQPVKVLKGRLSMKSSKSHFRRALVVLQFAISVFLIIGTWTVIRQVQFMKNKHLGFDGEQVLILQNLRESEDGISYQTMKTEFETVPGVIRTGASNTVIGQRRRKSVFIPEGFTQEQVQTMDWIIVDADYIPAMGMKMARGRNFSAQLATDTSSAILNEAAVRKFGWNEPVGKTISTPGLDEDEGTTLNVIGVVRDFHVASLRETIEPLIMFCDHRQVNNMAVRIAPENISGTIDRLRSKWSGLIPNRSFDFLFLNDTFDEMYRSEERLGHLILYFSLLAIFIGCLGLFGLAAFMAERRVKEIGIRKILGASAVGIVRLLSGEFMVLILIAAGIAWPIAYYGLNRWMEHFAYRTPLTWWVFLLSGLLALIVGLATVSVQAVKASLTNPVKSLRYE
jgi:putative ABC transport system permease protein